MSFLSECLTHWWDRPWSRSARTSTWTSGAPTSTANLFDHWICKSKTISETPAWQSLGETSSTMWQIGPTTFTTPWTRPSRPDKMRLSKLTSPWSTMHSSSPKSITIMMTTSIMAEVEAVSLQGRWFWWQMELIRRFRTLEEVTYFLPLCHVTPQVPRKSSVSYDPCVRVALLSFAKLDSWNWRLDIQFTLMASGSIQEILFKQWKKSANMFTIWSLRRIMSSRAMVFQQSCQDTHTRTKS